MKGRIIAFFHMALFMVFPSVAIPAQHLQIFLQIFVEHPFVSRLQMVNVEGTYGFLTPPAFLAARRQRPRLLCRPPLRAVVGGTVPPRMLPAQEAENHGDREAAGKGIHTFSSFSASACRISARAFAAFSFT